MGALICLPWPQTAERILVFRVGMETERTRAAAGQGDEPEPAAEPHDPLQPLGQYAIPYIAVHTAAGVPRPLPEGWIILPRAKAPPPTMPKQPPPFAPPGVMV